MPLNRIKDIPRFPIDKVFISSGGDSNIVKLENLNYGFKLSLSAINDQKGGLGLTNKTYKIIINQTQLVRDWLELLSIEKVRTSIGKTRELFMKIEETHFSYIERIRSFVI